jgi:hypothetical protein
MSCMVVSSSLKIASCIQGKSTENMGTWADFRYQQPRSYLEKHANPNLDDGELSRTLPDSELYELMSIILEGRNQSSVDMPEFQSGGSGPLCENAYRPAPILPKVRNQPEYSTTLVLMPPPRRFYRGFWNSIARRALAKASGGCNERSS